jgi:hypothetical protein
MLAASFKSLGYLTPAEFKAQHRAGTDHGRRSPATPAHAHKEEHDRRADDVLPINRPMSAVLQ